MAVLIVLCIYKILLFCVFSYLFNGNFIEIIIFVIKRSSFYDIVATFILLQIQITINDLQKGSKCILYKQVRYDFF